MRAGVPQRPALCPSCRVVRDNGRYLIERGSTVVTFEGRAAETLLPSLLPLLDGTRTIAELTVETGPAIAPAVAQVLEALDSNRLLVEGAVGREMSDDLTAAATYAAAVTGRTTGTAASSTLESSDVAVVGSSACAAEIVSLLRRMGVAKARLQTADSEVSPEAFLIASPDASEVTCLAEINRHALDHGRPWLQVMPYDGRFVIVGPVFLPGQSACRECYVRRRAACSGYEEDYDRVELAAVRAVTPAPLTSIAVGLAGLLSIRWLTARDPTLPGRLYAIQSGTVVRLAHDLVLRVPRCNACGTPETATPSPWYEELP